MKQRILQPEMMDDPKLDPQRHRQALRGLRRLHAVSGSVALVREALLPHISQNGQPLRLLDVATGGGALPLALRRWAEREGLNLQIEACDISRQALDYARQRAASAGLNNVRFFQLDILCDPLPQGYDVVLFSLFLHHLDDAKSVDLLHRAMAAGRHIIVCDLLRSRFSLLAVTVGARLLTRSDVVHTDAALSVRAAFTPGELRSLGEQAGLRNITVRSHFPARLVMTGEGG